MDSDIIRMKIGQRVMLRDQEYYLAPLPLAIVRDVWPHVLNVLKSGTEPSLENLPDIMDAAAEVVLASMKAGNNPGMSMERLKNEVIDYGNWREAFFAALAVSNIKLAERDPGKVPALTMVPNGTGSSSTSSAPSAGASSAPGP